MIFVGEEEFVEEEEEELTDEELRAAQEAAEWEPEEEPFEAFLTDDEAEHIRRHASPGILPSQFAAFAFRMPSADGQTMEKFSFEGRRHMYRIYDTPAKRILLCCGRQVEKSTLIGNRMIIYSCLVPNFKTLYVSPSSTQTKTFSSDRIKDPLETSDVLRRFTTTALQQNIFEKQFVNRSKITLRYAFLNADRTRGIPSWGIFIDEFQDILGDNVPVIEQSSSHAPPNWQRFIYAGTPKSLDNTLEYYRSGSTAQGRPMSTMGEWVVPCDAHGGEGGRYWNILGEKNLGKKFLICEKCGKQINPQTPDAQWAQQNADGIYESYRIPQLMVPWRNWDDIMLDYSRYSRDRFYNEVLGISFDSGLRPISRTQVRACCKDDIRMSFEELEKYKNLAHGQPVWAGIDWGTGENSYTVLSLGTYIAGKFRIFYIHRFTGEETDPERQLEQIVSLLKYFSVKYIGVDYGGGHYPNDHLVRKFGPQRVQRYQYMARGKKKVAFNGPLRRWQLLRTEVMSDIFNAIKRQQLDFPSWAEFQEPFAQDMLNIYSEYNESLRMLQYGHRIDRPDDSFHSVLYCFLVSMISVPRPDIIAPNKEDKRGPLRSNWKGPTDQG